MKILVLGDFHGKYSEKLKRKIAKENFDLVIGVGDYTGVDDWRSYFKYAFKHLYKNNNREELKSAEEFFGEKKFKQILKKDFEAGKKVLTELSKLRKPFIFVFGNGDDEWYNYPFGIKNLRADKRKRRFVKKLRNSYDLTYGMKRYRGINLVGFGGYMDASINYNKKDKEIYNRMLLRVRKSRQKLFRYLKKSKRTDILILHYCPKGVFDIIRDKKIPYYGKSTGVPIYREAIKKYAPRLVFCGHMHEYQGKKKIGKTVVVNPGDAERGRYAVIEWPSMNVRFVK